MEEKRIDPEDNKAYTWEEIFVHYKNTYKKKELLAYWEETCKPVKKFAADHPSIKYPAKKGTGKRQKTKEPTAA